MVPQGQGAGKIIDPFNINAREACSCTYCHTTVVGLCKAHWLMRCLKWGTPQKFSELLVLHSCCLEQWILILSIFSGILGVLLFSWWLSSFFHSRWKWTNLVTLLGIKCFKCLYSGTTLGTDWWWLCFLLGWLTHWEQLVHFVVWLFVLETWFLKADFHFYSKKRHLPTSAPWRPKCFLIGSSLLQSTVVLYAC